MKRLGIGLLLFALPAAADPVDLELALRLMEEGDWKASGIEFRRLSLRSYESPVIAGYAWAAAHQYGRAGAYQVAEDLLDQAEDGWPDIRPEVTLLRAENARSRQDLRTAAFYWERVLREAEGERARLAQRRLAAVRVQLGQVEGARQLLGDAGEVEALAALDRYESGRDKHPRLGGLLGIIPGMGYAYAGEYANAFRSLILNSIFLYGMVDTAQNDHWGGFAVITFFQITWHTGSIYGGIDASHRYNRRRLMEVVEAIEQESGFAPDWGRIPAVSLRYRF